MAILAVDEVMLREPRLLVPGMAPIGNVKVDARWSYASALKIGYIASAGRKFVPLVAGLPLIDASTFYSLPHQSGMAIAASSTISYYESSILGAASSITVVYGAILNAFTTDIGMFGVGALATSGLRPGAWFDTSASALRVGMSAGSPKYGTSFPAVAGTKVSVWSSSFGMAAQHGRGIAGSMVPSIPPAQTSAVTTRLPQMLGAYLALIPAKVFCRTR